MREYSDRKLSIMISLTEGFYILCTTPYTTIYWIYYYIPRSGLRRRGTPSKNKVTIIGYFYINNDTVIFIEETSYLLNIDRIYGNVYNDESIRKDMFSLEVRLSANNTELKTNAIITACLHILSMMPPTLKIRSLMTITLKSTRILSLPVLNF